MPTGKELPARLFVSCFHAVPTMTSSFNITKTMRKIPSLRLFWHPPMKHGKVGLCNSIVQHHLLARLCFVDTRETLVVASFLDCKKIDQSMNQESTVLVFGLPRALPPRMTLAASFNRAKKQ
mmetsp:Transcript_46764/g.131527  ORF Transcript_46764/g.131527 Transcript_46764/m.131527 type:complete len:122 (-) Transcript_46764:444-809(-)